MHKSGLLYYTEYKSPNIPEEKKKERIRRAKPREKKDWERGFVHRASRPTRNLSSPSTTAEEKGGDPVPNQDETRIKYSNPARVHAMLNEKKANIYPQPVPPARDRMLHSCSPILHTTDDHKKKSLSKSQMSYHSRNLFPFSHRVCPRSWHTMWSGPWALSKSMSEAKHRPSRKGSIGTRFGFRLRRDVSRLADSFRAGVHE